MQLLGANSVADVQKAVAERVTRTEAGKWVTASMGWHESILEEGRMPTRHELDPVSPSNPVFIPRGGHVVTVNTKALELAGITKDTPNPEGGIIVRDDKGEATGMLLQNAANLVRRILPPPARQHGASFWSPRCAISTPSASSAWSSPASTNSRSPSIARCMTPAR